MRTLGLVVLAIFAVTCGPDPNAKLPGNLVNTGGGTTVGAGGVSDTGGSSVLSSGGRTTIGNGGAPASGGRIGTGGAQGTGGVVATGGTSPGTGGRTTGTGGRTTIPDAGVDSRRDSGAGGTGTGGTTVGGSGGTVRPTGGTTGGTGGRTGSGGVSGRDAGADLLAGTGGISGTGGSTVPKDAASIGDLASSCYSTIVSKGYACGSTPACSACTVNGTSKEAECKKGVDCLAAAGASCDSNCQLTCLNQAGDAQVGACIKALTTAACGGTGC